MCELKIYMDEPGMATFEKHKRDIVDAADFIAGLSIRESKEGHRAMATCMLEESMVLRHYADIIEGFKSVIKEENLDIPAIERIER